MPKGFDPSRLHDMIPKSFAFEETPTKMADHNDPNAVNSIFSDVDVSAADLYDLFGFQVTIPPAARRLSSR